MQTAQSMHSSGSITSMFGPSRKQSTGQTSTQSVYLQRIQDSVTTWVIVGLRGGGNPRFYRTSTAPDVLWVAVSTRTSEPSARERVYGSVAKGSCSVSST